MSNSMHYIINGFPRSGKNTFVDLFAEVAGDIKVNDISSVDKVKEAALLLGWDGEKNLKGRKFLSDLKDLSSSQYEGPLLYCLQAGTMHDPLSIPYVSFYHLREPLEIDTLKQTLINRGYRCKTIILRREGVEKNEQSNHADSEVLNYSYDLEINNNGTLEDLKNRALFLFNRSF